MRKEIACLPGDGVGHEVTHAAAEVIRQVSSVNFNWMFFGNVALHFDGTPLPEDTWEACLKSDAILLGAVGGQNPKTVGATPEEGLLKLRKDLGLYANYRPTKIYDGLSDVSPLGKKARGIDFVVVRELSGGIYYGPHGRDQEGTYDVCRYSSEQVERVGRAAFTLAIDRAETNGKDPKVTSLDKANVLETSKDWRATMSRLQEEEFPDVRLEHMYVDNAGLQLVINPHQFDVVVVGNGEGDILTDVAAGLNGSIGLSPSASIGEKTPLFEPIHGSAPDIAGMGIANPLGAIESSAMLLDHLGMKYCAKAIRRAVAEVVTKRTFNHTYRTPDINGSSTTEEVTNAVISRL
jgi:3-isopropylmalate dehydrogenase